MLSTASNQNPIDPESILAKLEVLRDQVISDGTEILTSWKPLLEREIFEPSATNLAYYLALRRHDIRELQLELMPWGLSSLGHIEARVIPNLDAVISTLRKICGKSQATPPPLKAFFEGDRLLTQHTEEVFGPVLNQRRVRIMVTLPTLAAEEPEFIQNLIASGTDCIRINCAHDSLTDWEKMIVNLRQGEAKTGRKCKIFMDLSGPKIRITSVSLPQNLERVYPKDLILLTDQELETNPCNCQITCNYPEIIKNLQIGSRVWIDDGHLGTVVTSINSQGVLLKVTHSPPKGSKLRLDKGLNFPDTSVELVPLTAKDLADLDFVAVHADIIGYSFVQKASDIELLQEELSKRLSEQSKSKAIVAKIETKQGIKNLPQLIVQAAGKQPLGVMIARGDLAVEIGYERLAEMQEEILWLCQAAHVPVIWATQVLENLVKKNIPSRAEITDAAMSDRAECVMLNKGPFIIEAVTILDDVLTRMEAHQLKKTPRLRALQSW